MAKVKLYNQTGQSTKEIELNDAIFGVPAKVSVVHQVFVAQTANARQAWADSKDRSEVSGGGKKPWKQKGTGRARHGSIRSPIWKGGGVTFGPLSNRNYAQKINKKMNALAVKMCLSDKVTDDRLVVVETLPDTGKTKDFSALRKNLPGSGRSTLVLVDAQNKLVQKATNNVSKTVVVRANDVSVSDLLAHQYVVVTPAAVAVLEKRFK